MRNFLYTRQKGFSVDSVQPRIEAIRDSLVSYLASYPVKTSRTKHGLMGPVGKILQEVKGGKWDAESLTGYALNIHMMHPDVRGISDEARAALERGVRELVSLMRDPGVPITYHDQVLDRIDYGIYFLLRKEEILRKEEVRKKFVEFLRRKYGSVEAFRKSWADPNADFEDVYLFGKKSKTWKEANNVKRKDMEEFFEMRKNKGKEIGIEADEQEE